MLGFLGTSASEARGTTTSIRGLSIIGAFLGAFFVTLGSGAFSNANAQPTEPGDDILDFRPDISLKKKANKKTFSRVGELIKFTFIVKNTGTVELSGLSLTDNKIPDSDINCSFPAIFLPGETTRCTARYRVTRKDVRKGKFTNKARVTGFIAAAGLRGIGAPAKRFAASEPEESGSLFGRILSALNPISVAHAQTRFSVSATSTLTLTFVPPDEPEEREEEEKTFDPRPQTKAITKRFLGHRMGALLDDEPDRPRFVRRYPGSLWGGPNSGMPADVVVSENGGVSFSSSLSQLAGALGNPSFNNGFDIWTEGHFTSFTDKGGTDGDVDVLYVGADYAIAPNWIVGVLGQFDWAEETTAADGSKATGEGWMVGPYVSGRLDENLFFDWRAAWGSSDNSVNPFGTYQNSFDSDRWLTTARLTGNWTEGNWRMTPSLTVKYGEEELQAYTDRNGFRMSGETVSLGKIEFGPEFGYRWELPSGTLVEPQISLVGVWNFQDGGDFFLNGRQVDQGDFTGRLEGGATVLMDNGLSFRGSAGYDGIGTDYEAWSGRVWLNIPLN